MSDINKVLVGENTPEQVAYKLMEKIFAAEGNSLRGLGREKILKTYIQCHHAMRAVYVELDDL